MGFWCRYAPRRPDGSWPGMQEREPGGFARTPLEALLARDDDAAHGWLVDRLLLGEEVDPAAAPPPTDESHVKELGEVEG